MKKTLYQVLALMMLVLFFSCKKNENLEVDLSKFNTDDYVKGPIDTWLKTNLEDPYNISTVYRFERNLTDVNRDLSPVSVEKVQPMMNAVLVSFLQPFEKLAGKGFIKKYTPKQFVLYGSPSYNTNGSVTLGSADAGRTVILYELNSLNFTSAGDVKRKIRTIHHEFTHILNQNIVIPPAFEQVSKADYYADWTSSANTAEISRDLGFISRYARSSFGEDFAEMVAHLLVEGQVYFDNYLVSATPAAAAKLREKEKLVYAYYKDYFNIDFKQLQIEVQSVLKNTYGATDPADNTQTFSNYLKNNRVGTLAFNPTATHYTTYGSSTTFNTAWTNFKNAVETQSVVANRRFPQSLLFTFTSATTMTIRVNYLNASNAANSADYDFSINVNAATGDVIFVKTMPEGTTSAHNNGQLTIFKPYFEQYLLPYFVNRVFVADWLPVGITSTNPLYRTFAGFYEKGTPTNYFYGPITLK
ncbi:substrate import-associated zinc metallohydrolase lipoprotein [Pedobacter xixiisoli]|uniref:Substrate import-associated zinc metallohydrolase lipoprotein n=1 Tax=Pedobacter xixiisoli TaxID=1476464 RepID=A0A286AF23_9SPHI|nr:substrate import-associated zinc metallohydrolase lipoprotein [Pedobacter xixiisoli]SOD20457.1 substrate import-associated zinc metallohydrolase lipoprotein [Pedobacter xixiisoli]